MALQCASINLIKHNTIWAENKVVSYNPGLGHMMIWSSLWKSVSRGTHLGSLCWSFDLFWNVQIFNSFEMRLCHPSYQAANENHIESCWSCLPFVLMKTEGVENCCHQLQLYPQLHYLLWHRCFSVFEENNWFFFLKFSEEIETERT